jgi:hypothetical protein
MGWVALSERARRFIPIIASLSLVAMPGTAQMQGAVSLKGSVSAVRPDGFDVAGHRVIITADTEFVSFHGTKKSASELRQAIAEGMFVGVDGTKEQSTPDVTAVRVTISDDAGRVVSGVGVVDRVFSTGNEPVFRADGYVLRVSSGTELKFSGGLTALSQVSTNVVVRYEGKQTDNGKIALSRAEFIERKVKAPKRDRNKPLVQETAFPPGSMIDFDGTFSTDGNDHRKHDPRDYGGSCGWYLTSVDAALQERVRRVGEKVIPQFQRELSNDDPTKIPFRFYAVVEKDVRSDLGCRSEGHNEGLVLIAVDAVARLQNDDQLAAILADRVAADLVRVQMRLKLEMGLIDAAAVGAGGPIGGELAGGVVWHEMLRKIREQRGRMALGYMADAGFDPWQSPEAWRLLEPRRLPKDLSKLKYPSLGEYELEILGVEYKMPAKTASTQTAADVGQADKN